MKVFIVYHQPLYFLFAREKLHIPFMELEDEEEEELEATTLNPLGDGFCPLGAHYFLFVLDE